MYELLLGEGGWGLGERRRRRKGRWKNESWKELGNAGIFGDACPKGEVNATACGKEQSRSLGYMPVDN